MCAQVATYIVKKAIESEFSFTLGKFCIFCMHVIYTLCSQAAIKVN